jgi:hypothetical protein
MPGNEVDGLGGWGVSEEGYRMNCEDYPSILFYSGYFLP